MDNVKDDRFYLEKIVADLKFVIDHTQGMTQAEMTENDLLIDSVIFRAGGGKRCQTVRCVPSGASRDPVGRHPRHAQPHRT